MGLGSGEHEAVLRNQLNFEPTTDSLMDSSHNPFQGASSTKKETKVVDLDLDSLIVCASRLELRDLANMALSCRRLRDAAYSDAVWQLQCGYVSTP